MDETRKAFEAWATAAPREWDATRFDEGSARWPGQYFGYVVQASWEAWQAACAAERKGSAMTRGNILRIAVECGFKLRPQGDGSLDLNPYVYEFARAMFDAGQAAATTETASVLRVLIDAATERVTHMYNENCPDHIDHDTRHPGCPVCRAIERAEKLLTDHAEEDIEMVAVSDSWRLVPAEPTKEWIERLADRGLRLGKFASSIADVLAAAPKVKP